MKILYVFIFRRIELRNFIILGSFAFDLPSLIICRGINGALAYFGSWRLVYFIYGIAELIVAIAMLKWLPKSKQSHNNVKFVSVYKEALKNKELLLTIGTVFLVGFSVFGSFTYMEQLIQSRTGYNTLIIGLVLTLFGVATVVGGRMSQKIRAKLKNKFLVIAGILGAISLFTISKSDNIVILGIALFGFGLAFIAMQSTLVSTAQEKMPKFRGTAMSMTSFCMFIGGALGTNINGTVLSKVGVSTIFVIASVAMFLVAIVSTRVIK